MFAGSLLVGTASADAQCVGEYSPQSRGSAQYCTLLMHGNEYAVRVEAVDRSLLGGYSAARVTRVERTPLRGGFDCYNDGLSVDIEMRTTADEYVTTNIDLPTGCGTPIDVPHPDMKLLTGASCQVILDCDDGSSDEQQWEEPSEDPEGDFEAEYEGSEDSSSGD